MGIVWFNSEYKDTFQKNGLGDFDSIYNYYSERYFTKNPFRDVVSFSLNGDTFFLKRHLEKYWLFPEWYSPARKEWKKALLLSGAGFKTVELVAYGEKRSRMFTRLSFIITKKLSDAVSLEEYLAVFKNEERNKRQQLIKDLAHLAGRFHGMGFCHQDFYAGHIFLKDGELYLIDVQRLLKRRRLRDRWRVKDIAQLNYTIPGNIASAADKLRFIKYYFDISKLDSRAKVFIGKVVRKTERIARHTRNLIAGGRFNLPKTSNACFG